jgi:trigger factor
MSVVLAMEEVGPCRLQLRVEVPAPVVEAEEERVTRDYARRAKVPGFRKGKVPTGMVRRHFGDEIRREVLDRLLPRYWKQAAAEKSLDPLGPPSVVDVSLAAGEPLAFTAVVEVRPAIELRNYRDFALPAPPAEPSAEEVRELVDQLRRSHAEWVPTDRAAATGDRVEVEVVERGREPADGESRTAEVEVGSARVWEELSLAVTGLAAGQAGSFERRLGEGEEARPAIFDVKVLAVKEAKLPAADDELARHFGEFASFADFETDVARRLRHSQLEESRDQRERALLDQLTERHPLTLPEGVVHHEVESLLREYAEGLARRGVDLEKAEIDWQKVGEEAKPHAERRVKARLLLDAISDAEGISVSAEEFEQALAVLARLEGVASGALRQRLDQAGELAGLRARMRREKTVRYLLGEGEPAAAPAAEPPAAPDAG